MFDHLESHKTIHDYKDYLEDEDVYNRTCDILLLASKDDAITSENYDEIKCKVLIEEANGSVSYKAD